MGNFSASQLIKKVLVTWLCSASVSEKMSSVVLLDKVNVFSFAAGFFFLSAAALSAYLIYQEEEDEGDVMSERSNKNVPSFPAKVRQVKENKSLRSLIKEECIKSKLAQDSDSLGDFPSSSCLESESDGSVAEESDVPNNILVEVQKPCRLWRNEVDSSIEESTYEEEDEDDGINNDLESTSATWESDDEEKNVNDEDEEMKEEMDNRDSPVEVLASPSLPETKPSIKNEERSFGLENTGGGEIATLSRCDQIVREAEDDTRDQTSESITKLYQMEEDVKISRLGNQSQHKSEDDQQSASNASSSHSFLHYSKVTTIGVYGPSQEGEDIEELLKNRASISEWVPPGFFNKEEIFEGTGEHDDKPQADSGGDILLEDTENQSLAQLKSTAGSNDSYSGVLNAPTGITSKVALKHKPQVKRTGNNASNNKVENGNDDIKDTGRKYDSGLSENDSIKLTQWLSWEKDILGDAFEMESPLIQDIPSALVDEALSNQVDEAKSSLKHGIEPSNGAITNLKCKTAPTNIQPAEQVKLYPRRGNVQPIVLNEEIKQHIKKLDANLHLKEQFKSHLKTEDSKNSLHKEETFEASSDCNKETPYQPSRETDTLHEKGMNDKEDDEDDCDFEEQEIMLQNIEKASVEEYHQCEDPQFTGEKVFPNLMEKEIRSPNIKIESEINHPESYVTEEVTFNVLREKIMPHLSDKIPHLTNESGKDQIHKELIADQKEEIQQYLDHNVKLPEVAGFKNEVNFESPSLSLLEATETQPQVTVTCDRKTKSQSISDASDTELHKANTISNGRGENVQPQSLVEPKLPNPTHFPGTNYQDQPSCAAVLEKAANIQDNVVDVKPQNVYEHDLMKHDMINPQRQEVENFTNLRANNLLMEHQPEIANVPSSTASQSSACTTPRRMSERSVSFDLGERRTNKLAKDRKIFTKPGQQLPSNRVPTAKTMGGAPPWSHKVYEPRSPGELEGGFRNRRSEAIVQKKKYVSPYCHPAKLQLIMKNDQYKD